MTSLQRFSLMFVLLLAADRAIAASGFTRLDVYPPDINLTTRRDHQQFIVVATRADGVTVDVTSQAQAKLADGKIASVSGSVVRPVADGTTQLSVTYAGHRIELPVVVKEAANDRAISFNLDVMPVFMRAGCNTGSCHGAARGKDGFMLSLFGYDPAGDHFRITRELGYRRVNLALPRESMLLEKVDGSVPHTGGKKFSQDSEYYASILRWLEAGCPDDTGAVPKVVRVDLYPPKAVIEGSGTKQQFIARAVYTDGTDRDVTSLAVFSSNNDNSATITPDGAVTAANRGEAFIMARFDTVTVGVQALVLPKDLQYAPPASQPTNYVDQLVNAKLERIRLLPSEICTDEVFLRRATIDLVGLLPTEIEFAEFMSDSDPKKREKLIDRLLDRREFSEIWAMKWADVLLARSNNNQVSQKTIYLYAKWLTDQIEQDVPLNKIVHDLLAATGSTFKNPASTFYITEQQTLKTAENVAQVFMGIRTQCAQCHNHPFDRWTMDDYYSFASFFSQVGRKQAEDPREYVIFNRGNGEVAHPVSKKPLPAKFLGGSAPEIKDRDRREVVADWLTSPENAFFAPNVANRIWDHFFGMGIVAPVDDFRVSNPATNPELLQALAERLVKYNYNFKQLVRDICVSQTYQRSTARNDSNETDEKNFAHGNIRRIRAECLLDCINEVTEAKDKFRGLPLGARAVQIADGATSNYFLETFGRSRRETVCACDVRTDPNLSQSLHLLNGPTVDGKIQQGAVIRRLLEAKKTPEEVVTTIYIRCLSRRPTADELAQIKGLIDKDEKEVSKVLEDVFWAVLNSREFVFNH